MNNKDSNKKYKTFAGRGVDVAINRSDDLDKLSLEYFSNKNTPHVLDLGCGAGGHTVRMAEIGVRVTAIDNYNFSKEFKDKNEQLINFINGDVNNLHTLVKNKIFTDAYTQRTLHYLNYKKAQKLLKTLYKITDDKLYISVMGIESEAGTNYLDNGIDIKNRFYKLSPDSIEKYSIYEPVCLYSQKEFIYLLESSDWKVEKCWQSAFGNIKAICTH